MYLAKVVGTVVATTKVDGLDGVRLLVVEPIADDGTSLAPQAVAADAVQAGPSDLVYLCTGREASMALDVPFVPVDLSIVGHVDDVHANPPREKSQTAAKTAAKKRPSPKRRKR